MSTYLTRGWLVRAVIVLVTIALTWGALLIGQQRSDIEVPQLGEPSPSTFLAESFISDVADTELTESLQEAAAAEVSPEYKSDAESTQEIVVRIGQLFDAVEAGVFRTELPSETTTTTTLPVEPEPPMATDADAPAELASRMLEAELKAKPPLPPPPPTD